MIWLAWRQFRTQALVGFGLLASIAIVLGATGPHLAHLYGTSGITSCNTNGDCSTVTSQFLAHYHLLQLLGSVVVAVPGLVGVFWGAPLMARELETGTYRLAWTQSITRTRWLAVKLGMIGLAAVIATGFLSLMFTWWSSPIDRVNMDQFTRVFDQRDIVPIGYVAFAFALGVAIGALIRRILPAMATTLVAFVAVRMVVTSWVRPRLLAPVDSVSALQMKGSMSYESANGGPLTVMGARPGAWVFSDKIVDVAGHPVTGSFLDHGACLISRAAPACTAGLRQVTLYQPASRFWAFQWYETAIFVGIGVLLVAFSFWCVRRRLS